VDFWGSASVDKASFLLKAASMSLLCAATLKGPDGRQHAIGYDFSVRERLKRFYCSKVSATYAAHPDRFASFTAQGFDYHSRRPNVLAHVDDGWCLTSLTMACSHWFPFEVPQQDLMSLAGRVVLGLTQGEALLLSELCFGLEQGTTWALFRDNQQHLALSPVLGVGLFSDAFIQECESLADGVEPISEPCPIALPSKWTYAGRLDPWRVAQISQIMDDMTAGVMGSEQDR
jgi:hypothetical protein